MDPFDPQTVNELCTVDQLPHGTHLYECDQWHIALEYYSAGNNQTACKIVHTSHTVLCKKVLRHHVDYGILKHQTTLNKNVCSKYLIHYNKKKFSYPWALRMSCLISFKNPILNWCLTKRYWCVVLLMCSRWDLICLISAW